MAQAEKARANQTPKHPFMFVWFVHMKEWMVLILRDTSKRANLSFAHLP